MASFLPDLSQDNISFSTIPLAWLIAVAPRIWGRYTYNVATSKDLDPGHPRHFSSTVADDTALNAQRRGRIIRAEAAMDNGFENVGLFAAAVVAGNAARLSPKVLNQLSLAYLASRAVFNVVYIRNMPKARTAAFFSGLGLCFALFLKAGVKFRKGGV